jgi:hypothetical protein
LRFLQGRGVRPLLLDESGDTALLESHILSSRIQPPLGFTQSLVRFEQFDQRDIRRTHLATSSQIPVRDR